MKIIQLQLTSNIHIPLMGIIKRTLFDGPQSHPGIKMEVTDRGALCELRGTTFLIPNNMIECAVVEKEAVSVKAPTKAGK